LALKKLAQKFLKSYLLVKRAAKIGKRVAVGATEGVIAEAPLEVLEQAAERYQAGLSLVGDDATREYKEAFFGAAGAGAGIGGASRGIAAYQDLTKAAPPPTEPPVEPPTVEPPTVEPTQPTPPPEPPVAKPPTPIETPSVEPAAPVENVWASIQNRDRSTPASLRR